MIGKTISHYKILEKLGAGGMGVVYKAQDTKLDRFAALKFLPPHLGQSEEEKKRFIQEAKAASALDHPNICTIYEIDETEDGQMFIAMACYEGESLKERIERGPMPLDEALDIAVQISQGISRAHEENIVHRDIKPANIIITNRGEVKIVDFGLAKLAGRTMLTKEGTTLGTVAYMSPEQAQGSNVDHRTDVWALAAVLYEMITGRQPFEGDYEQAVMYSIMNEEQEPVTSLRTGVPMDLERLVSKALSKDPGDRYQAVDEILVDLRAVARGLESSSTQPKSKPALTGRPQKTRTLLYGFLAALLLTLLVIVSRSYRFTDGDRQIESIAVLPLENFSGDPEQEYFADGMTEALIAELAQIGALRVVSRTSVMQYKGKEKALPEIARELNVDAVVEGSVMRSGERVRITAQLLDAQKDQHLWAKSYERDLSDVLALQSEVAREIAKEIKIKLTPEEQAHLTRQRQVDPDAHIAYLKGRFHWNKYTEEGFQKAVDYFNVAVKKDPNHALAYTGLALVYIQFAVDGFMSPNEVMPKAKVAALKALQADSELAEAHLSWGAYQMFYEWNWQEAEKAFVKALKLNPNSADGYHFYSHYLQAMGRVEDAITETQRALALDPLSLILNNELGWAIYFTRRYEEAIAQYKKILEMDPDFVFAVWSMAMAYSENGMPEKALAELRKSEDIAESWPAFRAEFGYAYAVAGNKVKALEILRKLEERAQREYVDPAFLVNIHTALGDKEKAFAWLEKAYEEHSCVWMPWLKVEPKFDGLRSDPRFTELLQKMGLEK